MYTILKDITTDHTSYKLKEMVQSDAFAALANSTFMEIFSVGSTSQVRIIMDYFKLRVDNPRPCTFIEEDIF